MRLESGSRSKSAGTLSQSDNLCGPHVEQSAKIVCLDSVCQDFIVHILFCLLVFISNKPQEGCSLDLV